MMMMILAFQLQIMSTMFLTYGFSVADQMQSFIFKDPKLVIGQTRSVSVLHNTVPDRFGRWSLQKVGAKTIQTNVGDNLLPVQTTNCIITIHCNNHNT